MKRLFKSYLSCTLCPRNCNINRIKGKKGFCRETSIIRIAYIGPHFGEEPPISGKNGSGTVFVSGCSLRCSFCQNWQISHKGIGKKISSVQLACNIEEMAEKYNVHNINFVTPDHFIPHIILAVDIVRNRGINIPVLFNTSGYQSVEVLKQIEDYVDIYIPDFKYADDKLSLQLSSCHDYTAKALDAISEMIRQKGFLKVSNYIAQKGVLVRHLILPGNIKNSIDSLSTLFIEFGANLPISLMSQYRPVIRHYDPDLNRTLKDKEFYEVYDYAMDLGFKNLFVQFPEQIRYETRFLPDFTLDYPFKGNMEKDLIQRNICDNSGLTKNKKKGDDIK